jgi:signal transduction histidine kinase
VTAADRLTDVHARFSTVPGLERVRAVVQRRPWATDAGLTLVVLLLTAQPLTTTTHRPLWGYALVFAECVPLLWRRRAPLSVAGLVGAGTAVHGIISIAEPEMPYAALVALFTVATDAPRRLALVMAGVTAVVVPVVLLLDGRPSSVETFTVNGVSFATAWLLGDSTRHRRERVRLVEEQAVAAERARMAREMHDVVAHHVSLMVVQAESGAVLLETAPQRAPAAFDSISTSGRQALVELRRVLGTLRGDGSVARAPTPGIDAVPELIDGVRRTGLTVDYRISGDPVALSADVDRAVYRVVQESLTNTVKHASGRSAVVDLHYEPQRLRVTVRDDGIGSGSRGGGHGLVGMRERVSSLGGRFTAEPAPDGGWRVTATMPLRETTT